MKSADADRLAAEVPAAAAPWITRPLLRPLAWLLLQLLLLGLGLASLIWNLVAWLLLPLLGADRGQRLGRAGISRGYATFWRVAESTGLLRMHAAPLDVLADEPGLIVVANHPSLLDALMLIAHLPRGACIMKASLARNPFLGAGARLAGYIRNDVPMDMVRAAEVDLRAGGQLVLFPEGTRTTERPLNPFRTVVGLIAKRAQAPVQTVFIDTDSPYLGKGWPLWRLPPLPIVFTVRLGRRFEPRDDAQGLQSELEAYYAAALCRGGGS